MRRLLAAIAFVLGCGGSAGSAPAPSTGAARIAAEDPGDAPDRPAPADEGRDTGRAPASTAAGPKRDAQAEAARQHAAPLPADAPERVAARHIVVAWEGAVGADPKLRRSKAEARRIAEEALARIRAGEPFEQVARELSDGPSAARGGDLGAFGRGVMHPDFERVVFSLRVGEVSDVFETPFGFHVAERLPLVEVRLGEVLVQYAGARQATVQRSKEAARALAEEARRRLLAGEPLEVVARELSDGPYGKRGGDLGWFQKGQLLPALEEAAFALDPGGVSEVVETPAGYHVLVRLE